MIRGHMFCPLVTLCAVKIRAHRAPPPFQPGSSSWQQQQGPQQEEDCLHQQLWQLQQHMWQDITEGQYMASPGGHTTAFFDRSSDVHSDVLGDPQAYQTPPPPLTQETQPEVDEPLYGPGLRHVRPRIPLMLFGPRSRIQRTRPHRAE